MELSCNLYVCRYDSEIEVAIAANRAHLNNPSQILQACETMNAEAQQIHREFGSLRRAHEVPALVQASIPSDVGEEDEVPAEEQDKIDMRHSLQAKTDVRLMPTHSLVHIHKCGIAGDIISKIKASEACKYVSNGKHYRIVLLDLVSVSETTYRP